MHLLAAVLCVSPVLWDAVRGAFSGKLHIITVGQTPDQFVPDSLTANPGDVIQFQFFPPNHSVIRAEYQHPCIPYEDTGESKIGFFSGFFPLSRTPSNPPVWNLTINDTEPIFLYCGAKGSCINHQMVGVINPNSSVALANQIADAADSTYELTPGEPFPAGDGLGNDVSATNIPTSTAPQASSIPSATSTTMDAMSTIMAAMGSAMNSMSTAIVTASSATVTASITAGPASSSHGTSLTGGAIAGIAIGIAFVVALIGALLFILGRQKTLLQFTRNARHPQHHSSSSGQHGPMMETSIGSPVFSSGHEPPLRSAAGSPVPKAEVTATVSPFYVNPDQNFRETPHGVPPYTESDHTQSPVAVPVDRSPLSELGITAHSNGGTGYNWTR